VNSETRLTLLVRADCHLCDEMRRALRSLVVSGRVRVDEIDVDADSELAKTWGDKVPVLLAGDIELCHYRLDPAALAAHLASAPMPVIALK
jgi:glutaredoxin